MQTFVGHLSEFFETRAEVKPKGAVKSIFGWVSSGSLGVLVLEVGKSTGMAYGQPAEVILTARHVSTKFVAIFVGEENGEAIFSVPVSIPRMAGSPTARIRGKFERVVVIYQGTRHLLPVLDASETGIAILSPLPFENNEKLEMELDVDGSLVPFVGVVQYSQSTQSEEGDSVYRVGLTISQMLRTDIVRWRRAMSQRAA